MNVQLVTVKTYKQDYEAVLDRTLLSEAGIESYIADQNINSLHWGSAIATGGIRLQVMQEEAEQAAGILGLQQNDSKQEQQIAVCPICHSENTTPLSMFHPVNWKKLTMVFLGALTASPVSVSHDHWKCMQCHQRFIKQN